MNGPRWMSGPPKKILLATDLSPRCDRALDRAVLLAELWQAKLIILNVLEDVRVSGFDEKGQFGLVFLQCAFRQVIDKSVGAGVDDEHLALHR